MTVLELMRQTHMPDQAAASVLERLERLSPQQLQKSDALLTAPDDTLKEVTSALGEDSLGFGILASMLHAALTARERYRALGVCEEIFLATMGCFSRYVKEHFVSYGVYGFDRQAWAVRMLRCQIFRLGEMEFETGPGPDVLHLHIPSDARLAGLEASLSQADAFLSRFFPAYSGAPIECESWLLSPALPALLPPASRIAAFQRAFTLQQTMPENQDYLEWVYKLRPDQRDGLAPGDLPEKTSLQRSMKAFLLSGGVVGAAVGRLKADRPA